MTKKQELEKILEEKTISYSLTFECVPGARGWLLWIGNVPFLLGANFEEAKGMLESGTFDFLGKEKMHPDGPLRDCNHPNVI